MEASIVLSVNNFVSQSQFLSWLIWFFATYFVGLIFFILFWFIVFAADKKQELKLAFYVLLSAAMARGVTEIIRFFYHKPRPFEVIGGINKLFSEFSPAFPSGHATFFFAFATAVFLYHRKLGMIFFAMALINSLARVASGVHWPSDVLAGAAVGIITALILFKAFEKIRSKFERRLKAIDKN